MGKNGVNFFFFLFPQPLAPLPPQPVTALRSSYGPVATPKTCSAAPASEPNIRTRYLLQATIVQYDRCLGTKKAITTVTQLNAYRPYNVLY